MHGEAESVKQQAVDEWQNTALFEVLKKFASENIFNTDETGLFLSVFLWENVQRKTDFACLCKYDRRKASTSCNWKTCHARLFQRIKKTSTRA